MFNELLKVLFENPVISGVAANLITEGLKVGVNAIRTRAGGDPVEALEKKAIQSTANALIRNETTRINFIRVAEEFVRNEELSLTEEWCQRLNAVGIGAVEAGTLRTHLSAELAKVIGEAAKKNPKIFMEAVVEHLNKNNAKTNDILHIQIQILTILQQNTTDHDEMKVMLEELLKRVTPQSLIPRQIPAPPRDFTGREDELKELLGKLKNGGISISGLRGMGGIGKTALALVLANKLAPDFPDGQFYLDLKGTMEKGAKPLTPADAMAHVIRGHYPDAKLPEDEGELKGLYNSVLHGKRALLFMDNALDAAQVTPLIPPDGNVLLVTSRQHFTLPGIFAKDLNTLPPDDAKKLLLLIAPKIGNDADEIAKLCGYLPIALRLAGSALAEEKLITPAEYAKRLTDAKKRLELVDASLSLSYDLLDAEMQKLWCALAVFPDTFDSAASAAVWEIPQEEANEKLNALINRSLVDCDETTHRCRLHDLARVFADSRLTDEDIRYAAQTKHAGHYKNVLIATSELYLQGGEAFMQGLALFDLEWINIMAGQAWAAQNAAADETAAKLCSDYPAVGTYVLELRYHARERISWLEAALSAARKLKDRAAEGIHLGNLGIAYKNLGEARRAIEFYEQTYEIHREIGDRRGQGNALGNLGLAYAALGETRRAIEFYKQQLVITREIGDCRGESCALGNLGLAYADLGETRRAIEYYEKAFEIDREIGDREGEGNALVNLGIANMNLGDPRRAIEFYEKALGIFRGIGDRRGEGEGLGNLGNAYVRLGEIRHAIMYFEMAVEIRREIGDRQGEAQDLGNLGIAYAYLGDPCRAIEHYEQHLHIAREIGDRRGECHALGNLGAAFAALVETHRAIDYYKNCLAIAREIGDRRVEGYALMNMSLAQDALGQRKDAIPNAEAALVIYEQIEDPNAPLVRKQLEEWKRGN